MTVLITDAKYRMVPALIESLGKAGYEIAVCQIKNQGIPLGFYSKYASYKKELEDDSFQPLLALCQELSSLKKEKIILLPVGAKTLLMVSKNRDYFEPFCHLCIPSVDALAATNDKETVHQAALQNHIAVPESFIRQNEQGTDDFLKSIPLPCVVKPKYGEKYGLSSAERYRIAYSFETLQQAYNRFFSFGEEPIVQKYITGFGVGISLVMDENSEPRSVICHQRIREYPISGGPSTSCRSFYDKTLVEQAISLLKYFNFTGIAMVEFKGDFKTGFYLLEINPRIWGTFPLVRAAHSDFAQCWCRAACKESFPFRPNYQTGVTMKFTISEVATGVSQLKSRQWGNALQTFKEAVNPLVKDGIFVLSDPNPGLQYIRSMIKKALKGK